MPKELTWRKAIEKVLSEAPGAIHYQGFTEKIIQEPPSFKPWSYARGDRHFVSLQMRLRRREMNAHFKGLVRAFMCGSRRREYPNPASR